MKLRVLNYGVAAAQTLITTLNTIHYETSISDFDAFIFDPDKFRGETQNAVTFYRRQTELKELIGLKGGIVVCVLRPANPLVLQNYPTPTHIYSALQYVSPEITTLISQTARVGQGSRATVLRSIRAASTEYLRVLADDLAFAAHLEVAESQVSFLKGKILAVNSVGYPIAVEFAVGEGLVCFVPMPWGMNQERIGAAIVNTVSSHFGDPTELDIPAWAAEIVVPGATASDGRIEDLKTQKAVIEVEISSLENQRDGLLGYKGLLFGYGKAVLESTVRRAFSLLGFVVPEPKDYQGEWDIELHLPDSTQTAIGEIEGSDGVIDLKKYRQLNDYVGDEELEGRDHKGLLIGNGYRLTGPTSPERQDQFSPHALRGVTKRGFCAIPCTELFKAICAVLEASNSSELRQRIRTSMLTTVGVWNFTDESRTVTEAQVRETSNPRPDS